MVVTWGQQYSVGEKPTVILLYTDINHHAGKKRRNQNGGKNSKIIWIYVGYVEPGIGFGIGLKEEYCEKSTSRLGLNTFSKQLPD